MKDIHKTDARFLSVTDPAIEVPVEPKPLPPETLALDTTPISIEKSPILSMKKAKVRNQKSTQIKRTPTSGPADRPQPEIKSRTRSDITQETTPADAIPESRSDSRGMTLPSFRTQSKYKLAG